MYCWIKAKKSCGSNSVLDIPVRNIVVEFAFNGARDAVEE